jgi:hypothetical protein
MVGAEEWWALPPDFFSAPEHLRCKDVLSRGLWRNWGRGFYADDAVCVVDLTEMSVSAGEGLGVIII